MNRHLQSSFSALIWARAALGARPGRGVRGGNREMNQGVKQSVFNRFELQRIDGDLRLIEIERAKQLLGITATDEVSAAYRETVAAMVDELRLARRRIEDGTYGQCRQCDRIIRRERLEWRPWATTCTECAACSKLQH
ncbi:hypothetical protein KUV85_12135 [Nocardioides panacisoli]|uniref:TraR/DksA family transcriptional regulator n=1 Tax=Nocardioides panacisoli TaxID=627624 RepID=UPI001C632220|nr:TraR/DksA C4-type zinc finger protein [Nocardioides panacisoli]QYJ03081.1 hypothetical protein KUV85_12135 [Nocardioides panacisoli]